MTTEHFTSPHGRRLACRYTAPSGSDLTYVWLCGFKSDMTGTKVMRLEAWAKAAGHGFLAFDYSGHGESGGAFEDGTISRWREDALDVIDALTDGALVLVGSSMGGWMAMLLARARPERVAGMILLAPAPDFTEVLIWPRLPDDAKKQILEEGSWLRPAEYEGEEPYPITRTLIEDGRNNLVLDKKTALSVPVRILHGMADVDVPWQHGLAVAEAIEGEVTLTLVKSGTHRLSRPADLLLIERTLDGLVKDVDG